MAWRSRLSLGAWLRVQSGRTLTLRGSRARSPDPGHPRSARGGVVHRLRGDDPRASVRGFSEARFGRGPRDGLDLDSMAREAGRGARTHRGSGVLLLARTMDRTVQG